jgi:hypothetical protein
MAAYFAFFADFALILALPAAKQPAVAFKWD